MFIDRFIQYLKSEKRFSEHTIKSYSIDIIQFEQYLLMEYSISKQLRKITFKIIRCWIAHLLEKGLSPTSVNRKISTLKTYFQFLLREDLLIQNPMTKIVSPKSKKRLPVFIEENQIEILLNKLDYTEGFIGERDKLIMEFFYVTGVRLSELINIKINDIDFNSNVVKVLGKRNKERLIPITIKMSNQLKEFIEKYEKSVFLFTDSKGKKIYTKLVYRTVKKYLGKISSMDKKSPHILRHTFATHMLNNGADINAIKELLGHANLSSTQVYTHNTIKKLKSIYNQSHPRA